MIGLTHALARVSRVCGSQWGLLTTAQAERHDVTRSHLSRLTDLGTLDRVGHGVYASTAASDEHRRVRAAWLALDPARTAAERLPDGPGAGVVSHSSAATLHRLGDLVDDRPEVTYPRRKQSRRAVRLHQALLSPDDVTIVAGLPTTTAARTVADLLADGHDPGRVAQIAADALRRRLVKVDDLARALDPLARRQGQADGDALAAHLLDIGGAGPTRPTRDEVLTTEQARLLHQMLAALLDPSVLDALAVSDSLAARTTLDLVWSPAFREIVTLSQQRAHGAGA